mmetsp:Transcript_92271/g.192979  ORF Transcript_92271/g.192979 Transcript_92271/m.192979 type:complete len:225 (-) Transcript_92271:88-762(-)|eukprot:CAMPEP_0206453852 /NCGR_PEP_ID=MMETSP0324_2-20121206/20795_1 /ASSEMBLY_ACC=CAM_ASM_000836 /TAXON_ID=2866 /ORGANISM="Crypthecodinium cohnii, Strain Seligo" /LENGTH=224 /DNA_ID=CAMNT_0053924227 /DNA_START=94 /DNA_END=768 /DNA_ORIENTATION=+
MPKNKRNKVVNLTKTKKRTREQKSDLIEEIRDAAEKHKRAFVITIENERNAFMQEVRKMLRPGRLICAKNTVMQLALGMSPESECQDGIHKVAKRLEGQCAVLFSDEEPASVQRKLAEYRPMDFARAGSAAMQTVVLPRGVDALAMMPHSIEAHLRQLGMPTRLIEGKIHLLGDHTVCTAGKELTSDQAQVLRLLGNKQAQFAMDVDAHWTKGGAFVDCSDLMD